MGTCMEFEKQNNFFQFGVLLIPSHIEQRNYIPIASELLGNRLKARNFMYSYKSIVM